MGRVGPARWRALRQGVRHAALVLVAHRARSLMSIAALVTGVAAVVVMWSVVEAADRRVAERIRALGSDLLIVTAAPAPRVAGRSRQVATTAVLRAADADAIASESRLARAAAASISRSMVVRGRGQQTTAAVTGTTPAGLAIRNVFPARGRLFDELEELEARRVALLGPSVARVLFGDEDPVGQSVRLGAVPFEVVAVVAPRGTDVGGTDLDHAVIIPLRTAMRRVWNVVYVQTLFVQARAPDVMPQLEAEVRRILDRRVMVRSGVPTPFVVQDQSVLLRTQLGAADTMRRLTRTVATLALALGSIGIAVVMLLSVRERRREIGVRRAVGAKRRHVRTQFLLEAVLLALAGGSVGVVAGVVVTIAVALLTPWEVALSWRAAIVALLASGLVGVAVGWYPAELAARLDPARALRPR